MRNKYSIHLIITIAVVLFFVFGLLIKTHPSDNSTNYTETMFIDKVHGFTQLEYAFTFIGEKEKFTDGTSNPIVLSFYKEFADWVTDSEVPWCSAFVNSIEAATGHEYTGKLNARSWLEVGQVLKKEEIRAGDIVIFWRYSIDSWKGHVAYFLGFDPTGQQVYCLGGNQSNRVSVDSYNVNRILGYRRTRKIDSSGTNYYLENALPYVELKLN